MLHVLTGRGSGRRGILPPRTEDGRPDMRLGRAVVEGGYPARANRSVRLIAIVGLTTAHSVMALVTGDRIWWIMALINVIHALIINPMVRRVAGAGIFERSLTDYSIILVSTFILGDPFMAAVRVPLVLVAVLIFLQGARQVTGLLVGACVVGFSYGAWAMGLIHNDIGVEAMRLYALLGAGVIIAIMSGHTLALGATLDRKDREIKAAETARNQALEVSERRARQIETMLDEAPVGLVVQAADTSFLYANPRAKDILGLDSDHLLEHGAVGVLESAERERVEVTIREAVADRRMFEVEYPIRRPDGERRWVKHHGHVLPLETETGYISTLQDITAEMAATARTRRLGAALEATDDMVLLFDEGGAIRYANRSFQEFWRCPNPVDEALADVVGADNASLWMALAGRPASDVDLMGPSGESVHVSVLVGVSSDEDDRVYAASMRNITELAEARKQLEGLIRSKDQFIASVSHELRTPLTVVVGLSSELADGAARFSTEEVNEFAKMLADQSADVAAIVEDLLTSARADAGVLTVSPKAMDLCEEIREALRSVPDAVRSRAIVDTPQSVMVRADPVRVRQIVRNLVTNARKYGGPTLSILVFSESDMGVLQVVDDGDPIPEQARQRMFEPYEKAHERIGQPDSVGLGLTVSQRLALLMGGFIQYDHDGSQSIFTVRLPLDR